MAYKARLVQGYVEKVQGYGEKVQGYGERYRQTKQRYRDMGKSFSLAVKFFLLTYCTSPSMLLLSNLVLRGVMLKDTDEVVKHSAAIQIQNNITLLQRRAWNVLLANAYDELPIEEEHRITLVDLIRKLEFDSKNEDYLR